MSLIGLHTPVVNVVQSTRRYTLYVPKSEDEEVEDARKSFCKSIEDHVTIERQHLVAGLYLNGKNLGISPNLDACGTSIDKMLKLFFFPRGRLYSDRAAVKHLDKKNGGLVVVYAAPIECFHCKRMVCTMWPEVKAKLPIVTVWMDDFGSDEQIFKLNELVDKNKLGKITLVDAPRTGKDKRGPRGTPKNIGDRLVSYGGGVPCVAVLRCAGRTAAIIVWDMVSFSWGLCKDLLEPELGYGGATPMVEPPRKRP